VRRGVLFPSFWISSKSNLMLLRSKYNFILSLGRRFYFRSWHKRV
jgi:hypothetical protein